MGLRGSDRSRIEADRWQHWAVHVAHVISLPYKPSHALGCLVALIRLPSESNFVDRRNQGMVSREFDSTHTKARG
jgi:hypothetical protein